MKIWMDSHVGLVRENNEDNGTYKKIGNIGYLLVVADGVGGYQKGEVASKVVVEQISKEIEQFQGVVGLEKADDSKIIEALKEVVLAANRKVVKMSRTEEFLNMGTTVVAALVISNKAYIANVGDSRCYLLSDVRGEKNFCQITKDNTFVQEMVDFGMITEEEARTHSKRNVITRAIGAHEEVEIDLYLKEVYPEDILMLCSDGLTGMLTDKEIKKVLLKNEMIKQKVNELIEKAIAEGGHDNVTVLCAEIDEVGV